jgi:hypothetical protein
MKRVLWVGVLVLALLAVPASALGATRYAAPGGGETAPCAVTAPCSLAYAITAASAGDEVLVTAGTYPVAETIVSMVPLTVRGAPGPARPRLVGATGVGLLAFTKGATVSDLTVESTEAPEGAMAADGTGSVLERLEVVARGTQPEKAALIVASDWTITDSLIVGDSPFSIPFVALVNADGAGTMRNDTVIGEGEKSFGLAIFSAAEHSLGVRATNVIVSAPTAAQFQGMGSASSIAFDHSDVQGKVTPGSPVTSTDAVTSPPLFVNAAGGDFHEAPGSPTIGAGLNEPANGAADLDGNPRSQPSRYNCSPPNGPTVTDIGAYQLAPPIPPCVPPTPTRTPPTPPPGTYLQHATIKGRTAKFRFGSLTSPASGFECQLEYRAWRPCSSPRTYKHLGLGHHAFRVRAVGAGGTDATPVVRKFTIHGKHRHRRHRR